MINPAPSTALLRLLVSTSALPPEGDDVISSPSGTAVSGLSRSLSLFQYLARPHATRLTLRGTELTWPSALAADLTLIELSDSGDDEGPGVEATGTESVVNWSSVAEAFARRTDPEHFFGSGEETQRILLDEIRTAARAAARHFSGEALPLVEVRRGGGVTTELAFLGIWLADPGDATQLSGALPRGPWAENAITSEATLLVLDDSDVEGHGVREAVLGLSLLAVVFTVPAKAGLFDAVSDVPVAVTHESEAKVDGTPLAVKSQKLVQPGPKIYPSGLTSQSTSAPREVIVDVKAQRAYLFVDGKLAFETPVSTASKGRITPRGTFSITEKIRTGKHSTLYKSAMPFWNRLGESAIGMHTGQLPGYPASHGCIRLPNESARFIFDNAPKGTTVQVVDALAAAPQPASLTTLVASAR